ncbi:hypothetical protein DYB32_004914 [Aphanomyces invadans]|uniref:Protein kinase domain-containing protein n=1 Tax=Aphanomyces invadans TaxID=157072 RepID=A0A418AW45_9STRA|nr:hypothetical protein DYB32_004914 [Aphanomyces invadans]
MGVVYVHSEAHCASSTCLLVDMWLLVGLVFTVIVGYILVLFARSMIRKDVDQAQIQSRKNTAKSGHQFLEARNGIASFLGKKKRKTTYNNLPFSGSAWPDGTFHRTKTLRAEDMFQQPTYEEKAVMAVAPSDMRVKQEEDKLRKLTTMRRFVRVFGLLPRAITFSVSMTAQSNVSFKVADNVFASVYEVKLPEVHLVKQLAIGPFSEVYAGVGVKLLMPKETYQEGVAEAVKNFRREIWVMSRLDHPNVLQLIGASLTSSCYVLIMEYMANGSLYEYLRDAKNIVPLQLILHSAQDIVRGMLHVHDHDILQRDLKTKNLLVSDHLVVKVSDFGLSRYKDKMYGEYTFVGTPFCFGVVLWELIERTDPYVGMNPLQVPLLVCQEGLRPSPFRNPAPETYVAPLATEKLSDLAAHVNHARRRASVVGKHDFECSHEAMIKKIPIKQSRSKTGSTLVTADQIKVLRSMYKGSKR